MGEVAMKMFKFGLLILLFLYWPASSFAEQAPKKVVDLAHNALVLYGKDPLLVAVVKGQNAEGKTLAEIKKLDTIWKETSGIADYMKEMMESECADYLKRIQKSKSYFAEIFLMDNQGANVAITNKTSDYWQGDEAKFQKAFNQEAGGVFVDKVKFDSSTNAKLAQVSVPIMDGNKAIGVITFGINVAKIK
jgi:hypothetical protein